MDTFLPSEWIDLVVPRSGLMFVERDEQLVLTRGGIHIPDRIAQGKKSQTATVVRIGAGVPERFAGKRVLLLSGVGKRLEFGDGFRPERTLWACSPDEVLATFDETPEVERKSERFIEHEVPVFDGKAEPGKIIRP